MWTGLAVAYHIASRLAYVIWVGSALVRQDRRQAFTRHAGVEAGFRRFRRIASTIMNNDAVSFVVLCLVTRQTLSPALSLELLLAGGLSCIALGVGIKLWAAASLGHAGYYWHNFFAPDTPVVLASPGPYRFLKNPMYTLGYLHAYGFALVCGSWPGLLAAAFDQAAILAFHYSVEKPHFDLLRGKVSRPHGGNS